MRIMIIMNMTMMMITKITRQKKKRPSSPGILYVNHTPDFPRKKAPSSHKKTKQNKKQT